VEETKSITINDKEIQIRRLINPAKHIVITNVCLSIPNQKILIALKDINIIPISPINYLKVGVGETGYEHIISFRRQMFLKSDVVANLLRSLLISYEETYFRIFFTDDRITCFAYKSIGHTSLSCKKYSLNPSKNTQIANTNKPTINTSNSEEDNIESTVNVLPPDNSLTYVQR